MENLELYNKGRSVPEEAQKSIGAGRLKGMTDINPMWRIKKLTEMFGPVGQGWYTRVLNRSADNGNGGEIVVTYEIELYYKNGETWSEPIFGVGSAKLVTKETAGLYTDDEAYKKAYTDAISVACKAIGIGADIYYAKDTDKYSGAETQQAPKKAEKLSVAGKSAPAELTEREKRLTQIKQIMTQKGLDKEDLKIIKEQLQINKIEDASKELYARFIEELLNYGDN